MLCLLLHARAHTTTRFAPSTSACAPRFPGPNIAENTIASTLARACFFSLSQKHFYFGEHPVNFTTTLRASRLGKRGLRQIVGGAARGG